MRTQKKKTLGMISTQQTSRPIPRSELILTSLEQLKSTRSQFLSSTLVNSPLVATRKLNILNSTSSSSKYSHRGDVDSETDPMNWRTNRSPLLRSPFNEVFRGICPICGRPQPLRTDGYYPLPRQEDMAPFSIMIMSISNGMDATRSDPFDVMPIAMSKKWHAIADHCAFTPSSFPSDADCDWQGVRRAYHCKRNVIAP